MMDALDQKGYLIAQATTGEQALNIVQKKNVNLVFIDVKMPVMNGLEIFHALKKVKPDVTAVMMTGYRQEMQELVDEAVRNNAYTCIYKPFDAEKVLTLVREILTKKTRKKYVR